MFISAAHVLPPHHTPCRLGPVTSVLCVLCISGHHLANVGPGSEKTMRYTDQGIYSLQMIHQKPLNTWSTQRSNFSSPPTRPPPTRPPHLHMHLKWRSPKAKMPFQLPKQWHANLFNFQTSKATKQKQNSDIKSPRQSDQIDGCWI